MRWSFLFFLSPKPVFPLSDTIHSEILSPCLALTGSSYKAVLLVQYSLRASGSKNCVEPGWSSAEIAWLFYCWQRVCAVCSLLCHFLHLRSYPVVLCRMAALSCLEFSHKSYIQCNLTALKLYELSFGQDLWGTKRLRGFLES